MKMRQYRAQQILLASGLCSYTSLGAFQADLKAVQEDADSKAAEVARLRITLRDAEDNFSQVRA